MPKFVEAEIRNRLWKWYEIERNAEVSAEVSLQTGRIDLVVETDETTTGIEVKGTTPKSGPAGTVEQLHRYNDSNALDDVYLASNAVDDYLKICEKRSATDGIGVLVYPLDITPTGSSRVVINCPPSQIVRAGTTTQPVCVREPTGNNATASYQTSKSEDWLHYRLWETYDGIAEGALPNASGEGRTVNIDFLRFNGGTTAPEIYANGGEVIGYEAKQNLTPSIRERTADQISRYWESKCLSRLYLAVPKEVGGVAREWVDENPQNLPSEVGVVAISDRSIEELVPATRIDPEYDAFGHPDYPYHVGFGNAELAESDSPQSRRDI